MLLDRTAEDLSDCQKQTLSLSYAFLAEPDFVIVDEFPLGLAPIIVKRLASTLRTIASGGTGILLIEQFTALALSLSDWAYLLDLGRLVTRGRRQSYRKNWKSCTPPILRQVGRSDLGGSFSF